MHNFLTKPRNIFEQEGDYFDLESWDFCIHFSMDCVQLLLHLL